MIKSFAVVGTPIAHSLSPQIHQAFAQSLGIELRYTAIEVMESVFEQTLLVMAQTLQGVNVTLPFKERAFATANQASAAARFAKAANTLNFTEQGIIAHNTDGTGLVRDLTFNLGLSLAGKRVLMLGAGGAVRGCLHALLSEQPQALQIHNRTVAKAEKIVSEHQQEIGAESAILSVFTHNQSQVLEEPFDLIINGTSAGLQKQQPQVPDSAYGPDTFVYDMLYDRSARTPCGQWATSLRLKHSDGLGMLVEQAADAFFIWHGIRPETQKILRGLRQS
jgi:shikimate dehydrogenase